MVTLTLSAAAIERLDQIASSREQTRSGAVEALILRTRLALVGVMLLLVGCGSSPYAPGDGTTPPGDDASADGGGPPRAAVVSELGGAGSACPIGIGMPWLSIGTDTSDPIANGASFSGSPVVVTCNVHPDGGGFVLSLNASLGPAGSVAVLGSTTSAELSTVSTGFSGTFTGPDGTFAQRDCTWDFGGQPTDLNAAHAAGNPLGIGAGRAWGNMTCPMIVNNEDGNVCLAQAELRFENCSE